MIFMHHFLHCISNIVDWNNNINKLITSLDTIVKASAEIAKTVKNDWIAPNPAGIHWDGKVMESLSNKYELEDRL